MGHHIRDAMAELVLSIRYEDLPAEVIHQAKRLVLDTLACALGGFDGPPSRIVRRTVAELGGRAESTVLGEGTATSCALATLANGTMLRYLDNNDYFFRRDTAHASANLAPALAVAEREGLTGRDVLGALIIGYEIQLRLAEFAGKPNLWERGWRAAATNVAFSSAALSARLLGLDAGAMADALAISGSHNNTLTQSHSGKIAMMKASAEATVAKAGVEAALLAKNGMTGPEEIFEGKYGWIRIVAGDADTDGLTRPIDGHYKIMESCMKPYAAEMMTQSPIEAAIDVVTGNGIDVADVRRIEARFHDYAFKKPSWDAKKLAPENRETADHSFTYCIAVAMVDGACGPEQFTDAKLADPKVRALMERIDLVSDARLTALFPETFAAAIKVTMASGETFESVCEYPLGHSKNPLSDGEVEAKFKRLAGGRFGDSEIARAIDGIWRLDQCEDLGAFMALFAV